MRRAFRKAGSIPSVPLLPTRPTVRLMAPRVVVPGVPFEVTVQLEAKKQVEIEWCDLEARGRAIHGESITPVMLPLGARLSARRVLDVGTTTFPCRLTLPVTAPRSCVAVGAGTRIAYEVIVRASIPWWPDAMGHFALQVGSAATGPVAGEARVGVSRREGPKAGQPYAEISVGSDVVEVGGVIDGNAALRDLGFSSSAHVSLRAYETRPGGNPSHVAAWTIPLQRNEAGTAWFAFRVPADLTPSLKAGSFELSYWLSVEGHSMGGARVSASVPIVIVDRGRASQKQRLVAPHVGDARLEELFVAVGEAEGASVEPGPTLVVRRGEAQARVTRELAKTGTRLSVSATYPSLSLDLHVHEPALAVLARRGRGAARRAGLSPRCVVTSRDDVQGAELVARIAPHLTRAASIDVSDTALRFVVPTPANDKASIARVVRDVRAMLDRLIEPAPMPSAIAGSTAAWVELARDLAGELSTGDASITAVTSEAEIEITTTFDAGGAASGTLVRVSPEREMRVERPLTIDRALPEALAVGAEARTLLERLARFGRVDVDERTIRVTLDAPLGPVQPTSRARETVETSLRLAASLRASAGPFR